jgi:hypothetical protein
MSDRQSLFATYLTSAAMTALLSPKKGTNKMPKTLSGRIFKGGAATALALAVSLAAAGSGSAATRHIAHGQQMRTYYNYVPSQIDPPGLTAGQLGLRTNPTIVPPGAFGPPDPASCGGFHC